MTDAVRPGSLAALLRTWRERALMSQELLASRTGLGVRTIRRLEAGSIVAPRGRSLRLLAEALELSEPERAVLAATVSGGRGEPPARQLPVDVAGFAGRERLLRRLDALSADESAPAVVVITGMPGVGKTALAVHWAHRAADRFPDGQLFVDLRGFDPAGPPVGAAEAVRGFLDALGVPAQRIPADLPAQAALYRSRLADRRVLVVLDNAADAEQVRPLLPGAPGSLTVVTSRDQLTGLITACGARPVLVDLMSQAEGRALLAGRIGRDRVAAEPRAVGDIVAGCARLPLALAIVAARAATRPAFTLATLAGELREARGSLEPFAGDGAAGDVRAVFSWSYRTLSGGAARLFRLLAVHPGPDIGTAAAASLAGVPGGQVRPMLAELARAHLLVEHRAGRYLCHDLLRAYAAERAAALDGEAEPRTALHRVLDHYLHTAHAAALLLDPTRDVIGLAEPAPGTTPQRLADHGTALAWLGAERAVLLSAVDHAAGHGFDGHAWRLASLVATFLERRGHWHDQAHTAGVALAAARRLADPAAQALALRGLAAAQIMLGRFEDARVRLEQVIELSDRAGDLIGCAHGHHSMAYLLEQQGRLTDSLWHARRALRLFRTAGHRDGQAHALNAVGWYLALLGEHEHALSTCRQALSLHEELGNRYGQAGTWDSLGYANHRLDRRREAIDCYRHALRLYREVGERYNEAQVLTHLGQAHQADADLDAAGNAWRQALAILDGLEHPDAEAVRGRLRALDEVAG